MKKLAYIFLFFLPLLLHAQTQDELVHSRVAQFYEALRSGNAESLMPLLADSCRVEQFDGDAGRRVLRAMAVQLAPVDTLYLLAVRTAEKGIEADAEMRRGGKVTPCSFAFDKEGRFTRISLVRGVQVVNTSLKLLRQEPCCELPFENRKGFVVLRKGITFDGRSGVFVLDSGCKSALFNNAVEAVNAAVGAEGVSLRTGVVASGVRKTQSVGVDSLCIGGNVFSLTCAATDLTSLAGDLGLKELTGLLGAELLRHFETHIDYAKGVVRLYALDADGTTAEAPEPVRRLGFGLLKDYLPLFEVRAGDKTLHMVFDTGAQECCVTPGCVRSLGCGFRSGGHTDLRDADSVTRAGMGRFPVLDWGGERMRRVKAVVRNLSVLGDIDGIIGYPLVAGRHVSLNYVRKEFCFY